MKSPWVIFTETFHCVLRQHERNLLISTKNIPKNSSQVLDTVKLTWNLMTNHALTATFVPKFLSSDIGDTVTHDALDLNYDLRNLYNYQFKDYVHTWSQWLLLTARTIYYLNGIKLYQLFVSGLLQLPVGIVKLAHLGMSSLNMPVDTSIYTKDWLNYRIYSCITRIPQFLFQNW